MPLHTPLAPASEWVQLSTTDADWAQADPALLGSLLAHMHIIRGFEECVLELAGEGEAGLRGGPSGDLYVFITVEPHDLFERNGNDIHCRVPITFVQAALGDVVEVPTLRGRESLKIPPGTQSGSRFRLRGKGIASLHGDGYGDQVIETVVTVPTNLTRRQEKLLKEFERLENEKKGS